MRLILSAIPSKARTKSASRLVDGWQPLNEEVDKPLSRLCVALSQGQYHAEALIIHPQESALALWRSKYKVQDAGLAGGNGGWETEPEPTVEGVKDDINQLDNDSGAHPF